MDGCGETGWFADDVDYAFEVTDLGRDGVSEAVYVVVTIQLFPKLSFSQ